LLLGLLALLCTMPVSPARAGRDWDYGDPCHPPGKKSCGHPIILPSGNVYEKVTDFSTAGQNKLAVTRYYNSEAGAPGSSFGAHWSWTYERSLFIGASEADASRADGKDIFFFPDGKGGWQGPLDLDLRLTKSGATWTLTDWDDNVETYTVVAHGDDGTLTAFLTSIKARNGYTQTLHYQGTGVAEKLTSVTDSYGRKLTITYNSTGPFSGAISSITTPDGLVLTYSYSNPPGSLVSVLVKVGYSTSPATSLTYLYEDTHFLDIDTLPLTGIIDENGNRFATWTYDDTVTFNQATSSQYTGGADLTKVAYDSNFSNPTVTYVLGEQEAYKFGFFETEPQAPRPFFAHIATEIDRLAPAAVRKFTYDGNGYVASETDWNGNLTAYVNNVRGLPKTVTEASGTSLARTTSTIWHPIFHLPVQISEPNRTTAFTYDANGNVVTKKITADALTRSFSYTYNATGEVLSATDPRGNVANYAYDAKGNLTSVTDALGHVTSITSYDGAGRPLTIIDPNGVTTSLTYDPRGRLTSQTVAALKTMYAYDAAGNLIKVTLPDNSFLIYKYNAAHRLTKISDALGNHIIYTLDAAGNHIKEQTFGHAGLLRQTRSYAYSALNRLKKTIGAEGQTTVYTYDNEGNLTAVTDP
ncbi:MAG: DUF6531 domain-containing protein, partial [Methylocella sp.]